MAALRPCGRRLERANSDELSGALSRLIIGSGIYLNSFLNNFHSSCTTVLVEIVGILLYFNIEKGFPNFWRFLSFGATVVNKN
jgi:hypothetical protein